MSVRLLVGDVRVMLAGLPAESVHCVVTSPPYWGLRDYGVAGQIGLEASPAEYVETMVRVFREVRRVLRSDGTCFVNLGDSYANDGKWGGETGGKQEYLGEANRQRVGREKRLTGLKPKDLVGIPWRVAFALQADGWYLRQDIIWSKPNPMPESVRDRCTKAHEYIFLLSKSERYYFDQEAILEPCSPGTHARRNGVGWGYATDEKPRTVGRKLAEAGSGTKNNSSFDAAMAIMPAERNKRSVWTVTTQPFKEAHFATFPPALIEPCILAGCPAGGVVLDPFGGAGTTGLVADRHGRDAVLIELNPEYAEMARRRLEGESPLFAEVF